MSFRGLLFQRDDAVGCQVENVKPAISNKAKIRRRSNRKAGVEERGVFHCISIETLRAELKHVAELGKKEWEMLPIGDPKTSWRGFMGDQLFSWGQFEYVPSEMYMGIRILRCCSRIARVS